MQSAGGVELLIGAHTRLCVWVCECVFAFLITLHVLVCVRRAAVIRHARVKPNYFPPRVQINPGAKTASSMPVGNDEK